MRSSLLLAALLTPAALAQEPIDQEAVDILRAHGLEQSQVMDHLSWICDVYGPRLTGSRNLRRAQEWALKTFITFGLHDAHLEEWGPFGNGWQLDEFSLHVVGDNPWPVQAWPKAWSSSTDGRVEGNAVLVADLSADELEAMDLRDKIVLVESPRDVDEPFDGHAKRYESDDLLRMANGTRSAPRRERSTTSSTDTARFRDFRRRGEMMKLIFDKQPLAILDRSYKGDYGTIFVTGASVASPADVPRSERPRAWSPGGQRVIPQLTLAVEHYNRICRMLEKDVPVRLALSLAATVDEDDPMERNVIAELRGVDKEIGDEVVMIGAHFDSWHSGTGATDNGVGSAVMIEAMRLLTQLVGERGIAPRRTIRIALWSGEEQGLLGSRAYVADHFAVRGDRGAPPAEIKPAHDKFSAYYNMDNGTGRIRGIYLQQNDAVEPIFRAWLAPFHDLDAATINRGNTGGTDHQAFDGVYLPGFQFIQDPVAYSTRTHHSSMDNWDHAIEDDLKQAATIIASFAWHTAQRDDKLPRKPMPEAAPEPAAEANAR